MASTRTADPGERLPGVPADVLPCVRYAKAPDDLLVYLQEQYDQGARDLRAAVLRDLYGRWPWSLWRRARPRVVEWARGLARRLRDRWRHRVLGWWECETCGRRWPVRKAGQGRRFCYHKDRARMLGRRER